MDKFCYLGALIGAGGGAEEAPRVCFAWVKFRELAPVLTSMGAFLIVIVKYCIQSVL